MTEAFDPKIFLEKFNNGDFDGKVLVELQKLTYEQMEEVARLLGTPFEDEDEEGAV